MAKSDLVLRIDQRRDYGVSAASTVYYLNNSNAFFAELSAITADMGTLTAGSIVIGATNKLWLNDDTDGGLAIGGIVKEDAPFQVSATGHTVLTDIEITAGNGVTIGADGIRIGGALASALWGGEIKDTLGNGTGVHGLRWYDIAGIPAISILTLKPGTASPYFRLGRPDDTDWLQWDATGLALSGTVTARAGLIGGWTIETDNLRSGSGANRVGMLPNFYPFYAGGEPGVDAKFWVTEAGLLKAENAVISGTITAVDGSIAGWTIDSNQLYSGTGANRVGMKPGTFPFYAGDENPVLADFRVTPTGEVTASNAHITGEVAASSGSLGGWTIAPGELYAGYGIERVGMYPGAWPFYAGDENPAIANFRVSTQGLMFAHGAVIDGTVSADAGNIGGWTINMAHMYTGAGASRTGMAPGSMPFYAGSETIAAAPFRVTPAGELTAADAHITGEINASSGTITGLLQVGTDDPHILIDGETALLKSSNYVAGSTGWQINKDGDAEFNNLTARGTIKTVVFEKSLVTAFAGSQIVAKSASALYQACAVSGTTFALKVQKQAGSAPFEPGDIVRLKDETTDTWATVDAGSDETDYWEYTATWQYGSTAGTFENGHAVVDYGVSGQGYYIVSADGLLGASAAWALRSHEGAPWLEGGETTHVYAGTDGRLYAGGGMVHLDSDGIGIEYSSAGSDPQSIVWREGTEERGRIVCYGVGEDDASIAILARTVGLSGANITFSGGSGYSGEYISLGFNTIVNVGMGTHEDFQVRSVNEENMLLVDASADKVHLGGLTNGFYVDQGGHAGWIGSGKRKLTMRPTLIAGYVSAKTRPTPVAVGVHAGYSMPIYNSDDEELFFREYIAGRWDGASDITISLVVALASAETAGEDFAFQLSWESVPLDGVLTTGATNVTTQQELVTDRAAQYSLYRLDFVIDWDTNAHDIAASDHFACRIRRVAATGAGVDEVDGEIIVLDCVITYTVDKVYKAP